MFSKSLIGQLLFPGAKSNRKRSRRRAAASSPRLLDSTSPLQRLARMEPLEDRRMLAVLTVDSLGDAPADTASVGPAWGDPSSGNDIVSFVTNPTITEVSTSAPMSTASFGQSVTFTASVRDLLGAGTATPTGAVQFQIDGQDLGDPVTLDADGDASLTTSSLSVGSHDVTALYSGDAKFLASAGARDGTITTVAGGFPGPADGGPATAAEFTPNGLAVDPAGNLFISCMDTNFREVNAKTGTMNLFGLTGGDLEGVAVDSAGNLFVADAGRSVIWEENFASGDLTIVAGIMETGGYSGDNGPADSAQLSSPYGIAVDAAGNLFIADTLNNVIREVHAATGIITTLAGNGIAGYSGDGGPAVSAELNQPYAVAVDTAGNVFVVDAIDNAIREVAPDGTIKTIAGGGAAGYSGDGGLAVYAQLNLPTSVAVDSIGDLFIADYGNAVVREITPDGVIHTVAGNGTQGGGGDGGPATSASFYSPACIAVDAAGDLFIGDQLFGVVRKVTRPMLVTQAGTTTTLASSDASAVFGQSVTFTATVAVVAPGAGAPTGTVALWDGSTLLATVALDGTGQASFTASGLPIGTHTIKAVYSGDANFVVSASAPTSQDVLSAQQEAGQPADQVAALVDAGVLKNGSGNALIAKLDHAANALDNGHTIRGVIDLVDFIGKVDDLRRAHKLDRADAHALIADAEAAIAAAVETAFN